MNSAQDAAEQGANSSLALLGAAFPRCDATIANIRRGRRFAWQATVILPPPPFARLFAALAELDEEAEEEESPTTLLLVNQMRHPAAMELAAMLSAAEAGVSLEAEPSAGGAVHLAVAAEVRLPSMVDVPNREDVLFIPLQLYCTPPPPPFGGARLPGALEPRRIVDASLWRQARAGSLAGPRRVSAPRGRATPPGPTRSPPPPQVAGFWLDQQPALPFLLPPSLLQAAPTSASEPQREEEDLAALLAAAYS